MEFKQNKNITHVFIEIIMDFFIKAPCKKIFLIAEFWFKRYIKINLFLQQNQGNLCNQVNPGLKYYAAN